MTLPEIEEKLNKLELELIEANKKIGYLEGWNKKTEEDNDPFNGYF